MPKKSLYSGNTVIPVKTTFICQSVQTMNKLHTKFSIKEGQVAGSAACQPYNLFFSTGIAISNIADKFRLKIKRLFIRMLQVDIQSSHLVTLMYQPAVCFIMRQSYSCSQSSSIHVLKSFILILFYAQGPNVLPPQVMKLVPVTAVCSIQIGYVRPKMGIPRKNQLYFICMLSLQWWAITSALQSFTSQ